MSDKLIGAASAAKRFFGGRATKYEARRSVRPFWAKEHAAVQEMISDLPRGSSILDIPVGTGRYASIYKRSVFVATGIDASSDMLAVASAAARNLGLAMKLEVGDALDIQYVTGAFDAVVCTRLVNWFLPDEMRRAVQEMMRVARFRVIVSVELGARSSEEGNKPHEPAVWAEALKSAGAVEKKRVEIQPNYFMVQLGHG